MTVRDMKDFYEEYWSWRAGTGYTYSFATTARARMVVEAMRAGGRSPVRLLDCGCGEGAVGKLAREAGLVVRGVGTDIAEKPLEMARTHYDEVLLWNLDLGPDPLGDRRFDVVVCTEVLEHVFRPAAALIALRGRVAPGGRLVLSFPNFGFWRNRLTALRGEFPEEVHIFDQVDELHYFTLRTFTRLLDGAGLRAEAVRCIPEFPGPFKFLPGRLRYACARRWPAFFGYCVVVVASARGEGGGNAA